MPLDQSHDQEHAEVKGMDGWSHFSNCTPICGLESAKCLSEFESQKTTHETPAMHLHQEEGFASQSTIPQHVKSLWLTITEPLVIPLRMTVLNYLPKLSRLYA